MARKKSGLTAEFWQRDAELRREIARLIARLKRERAGHTRRLQP